jgi:uncharacterized protein (DUF486 family)
MARGAGRHTCFGSFEAFVILRNIFMTTAIGGHNLDNLVFIGFGLIGFGLAFFIYMLLSGKPENDD